MEEHPGREFQERTKYRPETIGGHRLDWDAKPPGFKTYPGARVTTLPAPDLRRPAPSIWDTVLRRRSVRSFSDEPLSLEDLSHLLWASSGATRAAPNFLYRAAPSAGGLYPIETYVAAGRVDGLAPGLYHYRVAGVEISDGKELVDPAQAHCLESVREGLLGRQLADGALHQAMVARAPAIFIWTAVFERSRWKYRERAYRYVYLDAGHIAAQLSLAAVALGLGTCQIGAFFDAVIDDIVGIDGDEEGTLYMTVVGHPARSGN